MRIALAQLDVAFAEPETNARRVAEASAQARQEGADLIVFPEAFLTGYVVNSPDEARNLAIPPDHPAVRVVRDAAERLDIIVIVGLAERDGDEIFNTALLCEPGCPLRSYRKTHFPYLGYDRFARLGDALPVFDTRLGRLGILICFDLRHPEPFRVLAMAGADLIVLPTNWPEGANVSAEHIAIARAAENHVWFAACNRAGEEGGTSFIGMSQVVSPRGERLLLLDRQPAIAYADIDLALSREKRVVVRPGEYEYTAFASRRPELYGPLTKPTPSETPRARS